MGLLEYMGHRILSIVLVVVGVFLLIAGLIANKPWTLFVAIILWIAAAYFGKTQHH